MRVRDSIDPCTLCTLCKVLERESPQRPESFFLLGPKSKKLREVPGLLSGPRGANPARPDSAFLGLPRPASAHAARQGAQQARRGARGPSVCKCAPCLPAPSPATLHTPDAASKPPSEAAMARAAQPVALGCHVACVVKGLPWRVCSGVCDTRSYTVTHLPDERRRRRRAGLRGPAGSHEAPRPWQTARHAPRARLDRGARRTPEGRGMVTQRTYATPAPNYAVCAPSGPSACGWSVSV